MLVGSDLEDRSEESVDALEVNCARDVRAREHARTVEVAEGSPEDAERLDEAFRSGEF